MLAPVRNSVPDLVAIALIPKYDAVDSSTRYSVRRRTVEGKTSGKRVGAELRQRITVRTMGVKGPKRGGRRRRLE